MLGIPQFLLASADPVTAALVIALAKMLRTMKRELKEEIKRNRRRVERLEGAYIPDGGDEEDA